MKASAGRARRNRQPSEVWIPIAVGHAAACLLAQTCPCVRRMADEGSGDFMASVKATCIQVQGLCGQRPEKGIHWDRPNKKNTRQSRRHSKQEILEKVFF